MIKKLIKNTVLYKVILLFRLYRDLFYYLSLISDMKRGKHEDDAFLLGTVLHKNMGDHLITYSELCFLEKNLSSKSKVVQIPIEVYLLFRKTIKKYMPKNATVFVNGGGWMGELWPEHEDLMQDIVRGCKDHRIILFPQTIFYQNYESNLLQKAKIVYNLAPRLTICVRDARSYDLAKKYFFRSEIILLPDITLSLEENDLCKLIGENKPVREFLGTCIRKDRECIDSGMILEILESIKKEYIGLNILDVSTIARRRIREKDRVRELSKLFRRYLMCRLVLTDRLHSMIICYLTRTPCVVWDNATHKIEGTYTKWLSNCNTLLYANKAPNVDIKIFIEKALSKTSWCEGKKEFDFGILKKAINNG